MSFAQGMQIGLSAVQSGFERADRERQQARNNRRQDTLDADAEFDTAIDRRRKAKLEEQYDVEIKATRDEATRLVEASEAFDRFSAGAHVIDPGSPDMADSYAVLTKQYLPAILKHESVAKKWEVMDRVTKQGQAFTLRKMADSAALKAMGEAAAIAPEVMLNPPKGPDGKPDFQAIRSIIEERRAAEDNRELKLRRATVDARAEAEAGGAYGGRTRRTELGPGTKAELAAVADELQAVNKAILDPKLDPTRKLELVNRKASLQRRIRAFDAMVEPGPGPSAPRQSRGNAPVTVGDWKIRQLD